jgi:hypothetical protein
MTEASPGDEGDRLSARLAEARREKEEAIQAQQFERAAQWDQVERRLERGEDVEWPPVIRDVKPPLELRMAARWYLRPFVMAWATGSIVRDVIETHGQPCETCKRPVNIWERPIRGYSGRDSISGAGVATSSHWATVTHRACFDPWVRSGPLRD